MALIRLDGIGIEYGDRPLLVDADFSIEPGERVCLVGRNGAGKTTLLNIIDGTVTPDRGEIHRREHLRISRLAQQLPSRLDRTVTDVVMSGLSAQRALIAEFEQRSTEPLDARGLRELEALQARIDAGGGWELEQRVATIMDQLSLPGSKRLEALSGGWQRRVALGQALVSNPDLLLLDEPTNHLDISTIEWLEHKVRGYGGSVIFITHDRDFLQKLATRIVEIDRGRLVSWPGDYRQYLRRKEEANAEEDRRNALFDKRLAEEEAWIRQGIKARRKRNEGRVRQLMAMREERAQRVKRAGQARIHVEASDLSGRKVIEARRVTHGYGGETLIRDFRCRIRRGDRIGLIGNNGVGKSTLLKILLGRLTPDAGSVKLGTHLEVGYFDQVRRELEWDKTVAENVGNGRDYIKVHGRDRHVIGYLKNFLFSPRRAMTPVKYLSGGECNRVLLAKLFARPTNLLVLDEPTNDLDVEMLEVLEAQLVEYPGTLIIVSHDRAFLDNVVTSVLVFEADGHVAEYVGGYSDWARRGKDLKITEDSVASPTNTARDPSAKALRRSGRGKLSYKLQHELEHIPDAVAALEGAMADLQARINAPGFYEQPFERIQPVLDELADKQSELDALAERWIDLEAMQASG